MNLGVLLGSLGSDRGAAVTAAAPSSLAMTAAAEQTIATAPGPEGGEKTAGKEPKADPASADVFAMLLASFVSVPLSPGAALGEMAASPESTESEGANLVKAMTSDDNGIPPMTFETPIGSLDSAAKTPAAVTLEFPEEMADESFVRKDTFIPTPLLDDARPSLPDANVDPNVDAKVDAKAELSRESTRDAESFSEAVDTTSDGAMESSAGDDSANEENAPNEPVAEIPSHVRRASEPRPKNPAKESLPSSSTTPASSTPAELSAPAPSTSSIDSESHRLAPWSAASSAPTESRSESLAPTSAPPPSVDLREPMSWTPQVRLELAAKAREFLDRGITEIRLRLDPPSLGKLRIKLEVGEGRISAHLFASSAHAAALLERDRGELVRAFEAQGIDDVSVQIGTERDARHRTPEDELEDAASPRDSRLEEEEPEVLFRPPARTRCARIDLVV